MLRSRCRRSPGIRRTSGARRWPQSPGCGRRSSHRKLIGEKTDDRLLRNAGLDIGFANAADENEGELAGARLLVVTHDGEQACRIRQKLADGGNAGWKTERSEMRRHPGSGARRTAPQSFRQAE